MLRASQLQESPKGRLDVATDSRGVIDHVLSGQADVGIIYGHEAVRQQQRLRVAGVVEKDTNRRCIPWQWSDTARTGRSVRSSSPTFRAPMVKPSCGKPGIPFPPEKGSDFLP